MCKLLVCLIALAAIGCGQSFAAVARQACASEAYKTPSTSFIYTGVTVSPGTNLALTITISFDIAEGTSTPTVSSVVWDQAGANQALTLVNAGQTSSGLGPNVETWALINPTPGASKTITITTSLSDPVFLSACAWTGVDQTGGATSFPHAASARSATTVAVTSAAGNAVLGGGEAGVALSGITGTTIYSDSVSGANMNAFSNFDVGSASVNIGSADNNAIVVGTDIQAAGGGGSSCRTGSLALMGAGC